MRAIRNIINSRASDPAEKPAAVADCDPYTVWRTQIRERAAELASEEQLEPNEGCSPYEVWESLIKRQG